MCNSDVWSLISASHKLHFCMKGELWILSPSLPLEAHYREEMSETILSTIRLSSDQVLTIFLMSGCGRERDERDDVHQHWGILCTLSCRTLIGWFVDVGREVILNFLLWGGARVPQSDQGQLWDWRLCFIRDSPTTTCSIQRLWFEQTLLTVSQTASKLRHSRSSLS